mmetsp:Transcript_36701/g.56946  ORF Transcript_36701/g.56946 Transcript_36701/m.56946 type:complete len:394 (+) Transcript_36701:1871-3052(+)
MAEGAGVDSGTGRPQSRGVAEPAELFFRRSVLGRAAASKHLRFPRVSSRIDGAEESGVSPVGIVEQLLVSHAVGDPATEGGSVLHLGPAEFVLELSALPPVTPSKLEVLVDRVGCWCQLDRKVRLGSAQVAVKEVTICRGLEAGSVALGGNWASRVARVGGQQVVVCPRHESKASFSVRRIDDISGGVRSLHGQRHSVQTEWFVDVSESLVDGRARGACAVEKALAANAVRALACDLGGNFDINLPCGDVDVAARQPKVWVIENLFRCDVVGDSFEQFSRGVFAIDDNGEDQGDLPGHTSGCRLTCHGQGVRVECVRELVEKKTGDGVEEGVLQKALWRLSEIGADGTTDNDNLEGGLLRILKRSGRAICDIVVRALRPKWEIVDNVVGASLG